MMRRILATVLSLSLSLSPLAGCNNSAPPPAVDDTRSGQAPMAPQNQPAPPQEKSGITTKQKVVLLAGAAALFYMYKKSQAAKEKTGVNGQYYLSKNGRVYYRDAEHRAHWVTPPPGGIQVPESEAAEYRQFQGYDGSAQGRDLVGLANDAE
jgi:hypothetical protein